MVARMPVLLPSRARSLLVPHPRRHACAEYRGAPELRTGSRDHERVQATGQKKKH
jgi:hypothetical protein